MNEALEIVNKVNWFIKPVADIVLYLFATKTGFWILLSVFLMYMFFPVIDILRVRSLHKKAAYGNANLSGIEKIYLIGKVLVKNASKIISQAPVILIVIIFMFLITGLSSGLSTIEEFVSNQTKIKELKTVLKQLDSSYPVAEITVEEYNILTKESKLNIKYFDSETNKFQETGKIINIKGKDIYFDAMVMNFEYSEISENNKHNLVLPYRIFSELVPQNEGIKLDIYDENGLPYIYKRKEEEIYSVSKKKYYENLKIFTEFINDKDKAKKAGIRSIYGNAVHKKIKKGKTFIVGSSKQAE